MGMSKNIALGLSIFVAFGLGGNAIEPTAIASPGVEVSQGVTSPEHAGTSVVLIDSGEGIKQELRLRPVVGTRQVLNLDMLMNIEVFFGGMSLPTMPNMVTKLTMESAIAAIKDNGDIEAEFTYLDLAVVPGQEIEIPPEIVEAMNAELAKFIGTKGTLILDSRGRTKSINLELPQTVDPMFRESIDQMMASLENISSPLPEEPIGIGAVWQVTQNVKLNGLTIDQTAVYTLKERENDVITLSMSLQQNAAEQKFKPVGLPIDIELDLVALNSTGTGTLTLSLAQLFPIQAAMKLATQSEMNIPNPESGRTSSMRTIMQMDLMMMSE
jgi:hypothetical protein